LGSSENLVFYNENIINDVGNDDENPSLYILKNEVIFSDSCEEYRRPISINVEGNIEFTCIFRSFREYEYLVESWEFDSVVYLIGKIIDK
jgi:hypothetical protein